MATLQAIPLLLQQLDHSDESTSTISALKAVLSANVILCTYYMLQVRQIGGQGVAECLMQKGEELVEADNDEDDEEEEEYDEEEEEEEEAGDEEGSEEGDEDDGERGDEPPAKRRKKDDDEDDKKKKEEKGADEEEEV
jgi:hypothetical protein